MRARRGAVALLALLAGCAAPPERPAFPQRDAVGLRAALSSWQATGRLAVRSRDHGWNAAFTWAQAGAQSTIDVHGPLGLGAARITRSDELIVIDNGHGSPQRIAAPFTDLEAALEDRLGTALPLGPLRYWLLGVADPQAPATATPDGGFVQYGWTVAVAEPQAVAGLPGPLPRLITVEQPPTRIRVVVSDWRVPWDGASPAPP